MLTIFERAAHRAVRAFRSLVSAADEHLPHGLRTREYAGFTLVYRRGNSLVDRLEQHGAYEPQTVAAIGRAVAESPGRTLVDAGANIGLISLAVLDAVPGARVYAFEPGPEQAALLAETIRRNGLHDRLMLSEVALADETGTAAFAAHSQRHAAGDGLRDTGRSGSAHVLTVRTETLDDWWQRTGRPPIDVVKLDTEGSELLILRGAGLLFEACSPTLFLEIHEDNLRVYPYGADDVHRHVESLGYRLEPMSRAEFVARPA